MRVGVQEPVDEQLLEVAVDEDPGRLLGQSVVGLRQGAGQVLSVDPVHDQHPSV